MILNPYNPVSNSIMIYIIIMCIILLIKPKFMYCNKNNKFKSFGFSQNKTFFSFPLVAISSAILIYLIFLWINIFIAYIDTKK